VDINASEGAGRFQVQQVGRAEVDVERPVPGQRLVRADGVVLDPVALGVLDQGERVVDLFEVKPLVLQGAETAFAEAVPPR
jgi:hypothetical protein